MIDTMDIFHKLTKVEYERLAEQLDKRSSQSTGKRLYKDRSDKNARVTNYLKSFGIRNIKLRYRPDVGYRAIEMVVQPKLLIESGNYLDTTSIYDMEEARKTFNRIVEPLGLPDLLLWQMKRVDIAIDLDVGQDLVPIYMFLINKGNIPHFMQSHAISKKYLHSSHNFYPCSKNIRLNFYCRFTVLSNKILEGRLAKDTNIDAVRGKIRLEVQYGKCNGMVYHFLNQYFCERTFCIFFDLTVGAGDYWRYSKALLEMDKQIPGFKKRIEIKRVIRSIQNEGSIWQAKAEFVSKSSNRLKAQKKFSDILAAIRKLNINPVTIPDEMEIGILPSLTTMINDRFEEEALSA